MIADPVVSVLLPVRNCVKFLPLAIDSILGQTFSRFELIVVDDGSSDGSDRLARDVAARDPRVRVESAGGLGLPHAHNRGIRLARGQYLARMDADDIAESRRLEQQVEFLVRNAAVAVVGGGAVIIDSEGRPGRCLVPPTSHRGIERALIQHKLSLIHPTVMFRREALVACGGYREQFPAAEDYDLWLRLVEGCGTANLSEVVLQLRKHSGNVSVQKSREFVVFACVALAVANVRRMGRGDIAASDSVLFKEAVGMAERIVDASEIVNDILCRAVVGQAVRCVAQVPPWRWPADWSACVGPRILFVRRRTVRLARQLTAWLVEAQQAQRTS